ncbi:MAG TPA: DUF1330 domain-containing protein, partial [Alphaproteobacteria bacterium]|nr:DUF1330 domain-containing protein [Alphaproteobacteria bacterium]
IARVQVTDEPAYGEYAKRAGPAIEKHGGRFLARGGKVVTFEGDEFPRNVVIEFPSLDAAVACYKSTDYQEAWAFQKGAAIREVCIVEGV